MSIARLAAAVAFAAVAVLGVLLWRQETRLQAMESRLTSTATAPAPEPTAPVFRRTRGEARPELQLNAQAAREMAAALGKGSLALDAAGIDQLALVIHIYMARQAADQLAARKSRTVLTSADAALATRDLGHEVARLGLDAERHARLVRVLPALDRLVATPPP